MKDVIRKPQEGTAGLFGILIKEERGTRYGKAACGYL